MTDATNSQLQKAYELIQQDENDQALAILRPLVAQQPDNADAWYLLSYAAEDPKEAQAALHHTVTLNPDHGQAREMLTTLHTEFPEIPPVAIPAPTRAQAQVRHDTELLPADDMFGEADFESDFAPELETDFDSEFEPMTSTPPGSADDIFGDDPFADKEPGFVQEGVLAGTAPTPQKKRSSLVPVLALVVAIVLIAALAIVLVPRILNQSGTSTPAPTFVANGPTPGVGTPDAAALDTASQATVSALGNAGISNSSVKFGATPLDKNTMLVSFCGKAGPALENEIFNAMDIVAGSAASIRTSIGAAGIEINSCTDSSRVLYRAYAAISDISNYIDGASANKHTFRAAWHQ